MSAIAAQVPTPAGAPDPRYFIAAHEAAALLGMHRDAFTRECRQKHGPAGNAILARSPETGQMQWWIGRSVDPVRLAFNPAEYAIPDLSQFTAPQRELALKKVQCLEKFRAGRMKSRESIEAVKKDVIGWAKSTFPRLKISRSALHEWDAVYNRPADLLKLVDKRGGDRRSCDDSPGWQAFRDFYLHENQPGVQQCWKQVRALAAENGWVWCSERVCAKRYRKHVTAEEEVRHRTPAIYRQQLAPFIPQAKETWGAGELSIGDHKQLDVIVFWRKDVIRPWFTTWLDWRTRKVVGWTLSDSPNSTTILAALGSGLDPSNFGGPAEVWIDNGRDYDAWIFHAQTKSQRRAKIRPSVDESATLGIFAMAGIKAHFAIAFNPNGKSRLERFFRTLNSFFKTFDTYTGDGIDTKPERLAEILKNPLKIPTFETVRQRLANFIIGYNANPDHSIEDLSENGVTLAPAEAFAKWCNTKRVLADPAALDLFLAHWHPPVPVGRNGVGVTILGKVWHFGQYAEELRPFKALSKKDRRLVNVSYDPDDLSSVRVFDSQYRFVCTAKLNAIGGAIGRVSKEDLATLNRNKSAYTRASRHVAEHSLTQQLSPNEQLAEAVLDRRKRESAEGAAAAAPPALKIVSTPLDGNAKSVERERVLNAARPAAEEREPSPLELLRAAQGRSCRAEENRSEMDDPEILEQIAAYRRRITNAG